ncbi:MAG: copper chaperone PCu(A)C, partial [Desulfovibrionaceae bacterium]|nr:copper chaperone PCu(A)C [Desulfovibrionaceae bacterium]
DPWVRASQGSIAGAFLTIRNSGDTADRLLSAKSPLAGETMIHTSYKDGEVMKMRMVDGVDIPAHGEAALHGGFVATQRPGRTVRLAVVVTNYRRDEFVIANIARLHADPLLAGSLDFYVIDNGGSLDPEAFGGAPVKLVRNPNTGGAGGFSRGMIEVLDGGQASHILVMDDDVIVTGETVLRTLAFLRQAGDKTAVAGSMLDMEKPHFLHEAGARWNFGADVDRPSPWRMMPLKHKLYLQHPGALDYLLFEEASDYGAFWFFAFPAAMPAAHGLCLPF